MLYHSIPVPIPTVSVGALDRTLDDEEGSGVFKSLLRETPRPKDT